MTACFLVLCDKCSGKHKTLQTKTRKSQRWAGAGEQPLGKGMSLGNRGFVLHLASMATELYWQPWGQEVWMLLHFCKASQEVGPWLSS